MCLALPYCNVGLTQLFTDIKKHDCEALPSVLCLPLLMGWSYLVSCVGHRCICLRHQQLLVSIEK